MRKSVLLLRMSLLITGSVFLLSVSGCQIYKKFRLRDFKPLTLESVTVSLDEQTSEAARFLVRIQIANPNNMALPLTSCRATASIEGAGKVIWNDALHQTLPAGGTATITVPGVMAISSPLSDHASYQVRGTISFEPPGELRKILTESNVPLPTMSFEGEGSL